MLDFASLLVAIGFSTAFLAAILLAAWRMSRRDGFLLHCATGAFLVAASVGLSTVDGFRPSAWAQGLGLGLLLAGEACFYGGAAQFRLGTSPSRRIVLATVISVTLLLLPLLAGYNGLAYAAGFTASAVLIFLIAHQYWLARDQAPMTTLGIAALYLLVGLSFLPRAVLVLLRDGLVVAGPPRNWAQDLSIMLIIGSIPALGALTMALSQIRTAQAHRREALTDFLTGLMNRRALFEAYPTRLPPACVAVLFDLDEFKTINDTQGHAFGDRVLSLFATALKQDLPASASAARIGGEEFALILRETSVETAIHHADNVRTRFVRLAADEAHLACTVSAGIASSGADGMTVDQVLADADRALYEAKRAGRNRVVVRHACHAASSAGSMAAALDNADA
ncbi:GGDEF domain-containing protein [Kaistia defluvii]|uniref:GGDEF domain-containing protein n=1 Tax=Kaistia defluvii TaxID=410841 RepID=UPI00224E55DE|nr:GGDEF domain-containing protein [Kaistia defluvii]MCX5519494.1 GGDEF domain-containing protein [Kaistia defluvii]